MTDPDAEQVAVESVISRPVTNQDIPDETRVNGNGNPAKRRRMSQSDQGRGKRLFGNLMGQLGKFEKESKSEQARQQAEKRADIESRLRERLEKEREELSAKAEYERGHKKAQEQQSRSEAITLLEERRVILISEPIVWAFCFSLKTRCEPCLYYRPWKLLPSQEDEIAESTARAKKTPERPVDEATPDLNPVDAAPSADVKEPSS